MAREKIQDCGHSDVRLRLIGKRNSDAWRYNMPTSSEVAALVVGDFDHAVGDRDIVVETKTGQLQRINELNASYLALQYPLLLPYGEDGFREDIPFSSRKKITPGGRKTLSAREWFAYRLHDRENDASTILSSRRLFQQFVVDAYTMVETSRVKFIRLNQKKLRCDIYKGLGDAVLRGDTDPSTQGRRIILPSSFTGGARFMIQNYQDAMAICRWAGYPDLFITFTCNPRWPEIVRFLEIKNLNPEDRPDIVCRIFKVKLDALINDLRKNKIFGKVIAVIYAIEFQKRGLPHAHILVFLAKEDKYPTSDDIDRIISAEIPDESVDPYYYAAVKEHMMHGPCGFDRTDSPCMSEGRCTRHFPKKFINASTIDEDGYPCYRRRNDGRIIEKNGTALDNRFVVPHNQQLLLKYGAHINVEWCNQSRSIKYLFKYVNKGHGRVTASFYSNKDTAEADKPVDEVNMYYDCRYVSSCETAWRQLGSEIQYKYPPVERLSFHLSNEQSIIFDDSESIEDVLNKNTVKESMFLAWMEANKIYPEARELTYVEAPTKFTWKQDIRKWVPRKKGMSIGRLFFVSPGSGDMYYLRCLINIVRGATCYVDYKRVNGIQHASYREACYALGLLEDDKEYIDGMIEASHWATAESLRCLFASLLSSGSFSRPEDVWNKCWDYLSDDLLRRRRLLLQHPDLVLSEHEIKNLALLEIEKLLRSRALFIEHNNLFSNLTDEQRNVYSKIIHRVESNDGGVFFVYGYGGTAKKFLWKALSSGLRSKGEIVLNVASSCIASLLLPGGKTAHSRFVIPLNPHGESTCNIKQGSPLAELIIRCRLIIWDEAPMMHKHCFESVDATLKDIMSIADKSNSTKPFGGKTIVFGGDFRQILPVIPKGSRQDIVNATINSSDLWDQCTILRLTKNMRLKALRESDEYADLAQFAEWIASIGDGTIGESNDGCATIDIPEDILLEASNDPIATIVESTYPIFRDIVDDPTYLKERSILAPTLDVVESINQYMTSLNSSEGQTYLSSDSICKSDRNVDLLNDLHTPEFLNGIKCSGVPNHELYLKVGTPVMLLRNIDHSAGLCNGTRLVVTRLSMHVLECKILTGANTGHKVLIPRMSLTPSDLRIPFKFRRRQFPLMVSYAMTINKSQGQSLSHVGLYLKNPVFSHGQLYVAVSRVTNRKGLKILVCGDDKSKNNQTKNVVYKEVFRNL